MRYQEQSARQARLFSGSAPWDELLAAAEALPLPVKPEVVMLEMVQATGLATGKIALDVGSYGGRHAVPLARHFGCSAIALDLVWSGLEAASAGGPEGVWFVQGDAHELPLRDGSIDLVWSYDMLTCVSPAEFFRECARVLAPTGSIVLHAMYFTELMEPQERQQLSAALALGDGMDRTTAERAMANAGLARVETIELGSQQLESSLLEGSPRLADDHLTVMRLRRAADNLISEFGADWYATVVGSHQWMPLAALGKLEVVVYRLHADHHSGTDRRSTGE